VVPGQEGTNVGTIYDFVRDAMNAANQLFQQLVKNPESKMNTVKNEYITYVYMSMIVFDASTGKSTSGYAFTAWQQAQSLGSDGKSDRWTAPYNGPSGTGACTSVYSHQDNAKRGVLPSQQDIITAREFGKINNNTGIPIGITQRGADVYPVRSKPNGNVPYEPRITYDYFDGWGGW